MRVRDHIALSTAGAGILLPVLGRAALLPWAASILIDVDHLVWFCVHERRVNPIAARRYFDGAQPAQHAGTRLLHSPWALALLTALGSRWYGVRLLAIGMIFHVTLDTYHELRTDWARRVALRRDGETCQRCGAHGPEIFAHRWRQPWLLPSYCAECFVSLCLACHEDAHIHGAARVAPGQFSIRRTSTSKPTGVSHHGP